jgi:hypothetical protein
MWVRSRAWRTKLPGFPPSCEPSPSWTRLSSRASRPRSNPPAQTPREQERFHRKTERQEGLVAASCAKRRCTTNGPSWSFAPHRTVEEDGRGPARGLRAVLKESAGTPDA